MASTFPTSLDTIPDAPVAPALGGSTPTHAEMHDLLRDAVVALEATVGTDAAAKLARLLGVLGGQTLIGGTAATDALTLQGTSGDGTGTAKAVRVAVGNNGSTEAVTVRNNGNVGIGNTDPGYPLVVGSGTGALQADASGNIAVGGPPGTMQTTAGNYAITANATTVSSAASLSGSQLAIGARLSANPTANGSATFRSVYSYIEIAAGNTYDITNGIRALEFQARHKGTGTVGAVAGVFGLAYNEASGTTTFNVSAQAQAYNQSTGIITENNAFNGLAINKSSGSIGLNKGIETLAQNLGSGTVTLNAGAVINSLKSGTGSVTTNIGVAIVCANQSATGMVTKMVGLEIGGANSAWSNSGAIADCYALYIGSSTNVGTNKWSIYNQSPAVSYFAGSLALGVTAASAKVHAISTTEQLRLGYDASNYLSSTTDSTGKTTLTAVGTAPNLKWLMSDATTNAIYDLVTFSKNSSGAGAAGLGVRVNLAAKSSTTADTLVGAIDASWVDATHASRKGRVKISAYDTAIRECIRAEASGTAAMLGFYGVTAVVRPTALTTQLTTLTYTAPSVADYAIQNLTSTGGFGFVTADEGNSVLAVIKNLQDRVAQLETKLQSLGLLT